MFEIYFCLWKSIRDQFNSSNVLGISGNKLKLTQNGQISKLCLDWRVCYVQFLATVYRSRYSRDRQVSNLTSNQSDENEENMISSSSKYNDYIRPLFAEFIGQLMFAFIHSSTANTISTVGGAVTGVAGNPLLPAVADGLTVTIAVITIGGIR